MTEIELSKLAESINNNPDDNDVMRIFKQTGRDSIENVLRLHPFIKDRLTKAIIATRPVGG